MKGAIHTMYTNGVVRNAEGKVVAVYDQEKKLVDIDGIPVALRADDAEQAMELVAQHLA